MQPEAHWFLVAVLLNSLEANLIAKQCFKQWCLQQPSFSPLFKILAPAGFFGVGLIPVRLRSGTIKAWLKRKTENKKNLRRIQGVPTKKGNQCWKPWEYHTLVWKLEFDSRKRLLIIKTCTAPFFLHFPSIISFLHFGPFGGSRPRKKDREEMSHPPRSHPYPLLLTGSRGPLLCWPTTTIWN